MVKRTYSALAIIFLGASVFLFYSFYREAKNSAITKLHEEQAIHAQQAAQGIEDFFATWTRSLTSLAKMDAIIDNDAVGQRYLQLFFEANQGRIESITRLNERGAILYNFPSLNSVGRNVSDQKHVQELLRNHKPVISDVFKAVEGFNSVALHVPVFRGSVFKGSVGILINFENLAKRYLDVIKIGETGYAWVVSRDGTILYTPVPGVTGKSVFETIKEYPSLVVMVNEMLKGHAGAATYTYDRIGARDVGQTRKYAVYMPVQIGNTFWSISVASAEQDVLSGLIAFRNKLALVIGALFVCGMVFSILGVKAWFIVKEEEKRTQIEHELQQKRDELTHVSRVSMMGQLAATLAHELNQPLGAILRNAEAGELFLQDPSPDLDELRAILGDIRKDDQRAGAVIDRMRAMMKHRAVELCRLDLSLLAGETINLVRLDAEKRHVRLALDTDQALPPVHGDRVQVQQVLLNLLLNALDAVDDNLSERRLVTVRARPVGATVEVAVSDTGHGIAADKILQVFEPFFSSKPNGLGMGLAISRSIIEAHGGQLFANNNEAGGATFTISLPVATGGDVK